MPRESGCWINQVLFVLEGRGAGESFCSKCVVKMMLVERKGRGTLDRQICSSIVYIQTLNPTIYIRQ